MFNHEAVVIRVIILKHICRPFILLFLVMPCSTHLKVPLDVYHTN